MKKKLFSLILLIMLMLVPKVNACVLTYEEYSEYEIQQSFIVGEYVFNTDTGYSPSLEDFAIAARTIPEGEDEYIYQILNIDMGSTKYYKKTEIFSNASTQNTKDFPKSDVTWEYWNNINGASEDDYDMFTCMVGECDINISYTTLETVGEGEYKTEATRTVQIESTNKIKEVYYCLTSGEECEPTTKAQLGSDNTIKVKYPTSIGGQKICTKAIDEYGNYTDIICDESFVLVDNGFAKATATENLGTVIEKEPNPLDDLFEITYSVSGGETIYYYYVDGEKFLLTDLSDLPEGQIKVEVKVIGGNGLVVTEQRVINVINHTVTYDYKTNGGTSSDITTYKASFKGKAKLTEKAYKDGYEFVGWATTPNTEIPLESLVVEEDITLYAIFKGKIKANFEIATKDGSIPATTEYETVECVVYNNVDTCEIEIPQINAKVGYEALGWSKTRYSKTAEYVGGEKVEIKSDEYYYSVTKNKIGKTGTFYYYEDGQVKEEVLKCYTYNGELSCNINPGDITSGDYNGKEVIGFTEDPNVLKPTDDFELDQGKQYYAYYEDEFEVKYKTGIDSYYTEKVKVNYIVTESGVETRVNNITLRDAEELDGWEFIGYRTDDKEGDPTAQPGDVVTPKGDLTYYAIYKKKYTVTYSLDADVENKPTNLIGYAYYYTATNTETKYQFRLSEIDKIHKPSHIFETWKIEDVAYDPGTLITVDKNLTVTAEWRVDGCIIYFDYATNGGTSADKTSVTYINGDGVMSLEDIKAYKTGWTFIGWTDKPGATTNALTKYEPESTENDITLYAMFERTVRVDFKIQDGNQRFSLSSDERQEFKIYNAETTTDVIMPSVNILNGNYEFLGWSTVPDSTTPEYQPGQVAKVESYQAFYTVTRAKKPLAANFNYLDDRGNGAIDIQRCYLFNGATSCTVTPGITESIVGDAVLGGWSTSETEIKTTTKYAITKETNYYAVYDKVITATFHSGMDEASTVIETKAIQMIISSSGTISKTPNILMPEPDGIAGYTTLGWRTDKTATTQQYTKDQNINIGSSVDYYGVYVKTITLSYAPQGGTPTPSSETKQLYYNTAEKFDDIRVEFTLASAISKVGYQFAGWSVENTSTKHNADSVIRINTTTKMYATWDVVSYKVTYDYATHGGSSVTTQSKQTPYLTQIDLTPTAYREGYEFVGWTKDVNSNKVLTSLEMPAENITLYAVFRKSIKANWVLSDPNAGSLVTNSTSCYKYNNATNCKVQTAAVTTSSGYTVSGWTRTQGSTQVEIANNSQVTVSAEEVFYSITRKESPITGTFYYPANKVDPDTNETLEEVEIVNKVVNCYQYNGASKCTITAPIKPSSYEGATFDDWTYSKTGLTGVSYELTENKVYYSHYTSILEFTYHEGRNNDIITDTKNLTFVLAENGDNKSMPTFTLRTPTNFDDYKQIGWTETEDALVTTAEHAAGKQITTDISYELYGLYQRNLNLTYDANQGLTTPASQSQVQTYHSYLGQTAHTYTLSPAINRIGYTFNKWATNSTSGTQVAASSNVTIEEHTKYYAIWTANQYNITYNYVNGNAGTYNPPSGTYDQEVRISNPNKTITITGNANGMGATIGANTTQTLTFAGWTSNADTSTAKYGTSGNINNDWSNTSTKLKNEYFKNLNPTHGSTVAMTANWTCSAMKVPTISRTGYTCNWNTAANGSGTTYASGASYSPDCSGVQTITLYARCTPNNYTVSFNGNGGTPGQASKTVTYDSAYGTLPSASLTGFTHNGWYTAASGGSQVTSSTVYKTAGDSTLYAQWTRNKYPVSISKDSGGSLSATSIQVPFAQSATFTATPSSGYYFESVSCSSGYSVSGGTSGSTGAQTITVTNNSTTNSGSCSVTFHRSPVSATPTCSAGTVSGTTCSFTSDASVCGYNQEWRDCATGSNTCSGGYYCNSGSLSGQYCITYTNATASTKCGLGFTLSGGSCVKYYSDGNACVSACGACAVNADKTSYICYGDKPTTSYSCSSGSLSGAYCAHYSNASYSDCLTGSNTCQGGYVNTTAKSCTDSSYFSYSCPSGSSLSGTTCYFND